MDSVDDTARDDVALARKVSRWLQATGVLATEMSVDLVDIISAARSVQADLDELLKLDVTQPEQADAALDLLGRLHAWLFTEIKHHVLQLEKRWPELEERVAALSPDTD